MMIGGMRLSPARPVNELVEKIHARIVSGEYAPGIRLRQEVLAREFDVSRTPIREALLQLEAKGVISQAHRQSAIVCMPSSQDVRETYQVRAEVEGLAAQLAAKWISDDQLYELQQIHERFGRAVRDLAGVRSNTRRAIRAGAIRPAKAAAQASANWISTNAKFHAIIHDAANNACLRRVISDLHLGYTRNIMASSALGMDSHRMEQNIVHHGYILRALEKHDQLSARQAMVQHIVEASEFVVAWFENRSRETNA